MTRNIIILCALITGLCVSAEAGYTVIVRDQVTPQYIQVQRADGLKTVPNPGPVPVYPATARKKICAAADIYSADQLQRSEVWEDSAGTATSAAVLAACPNLRAEITVQIKDIRKTALAKLTVDSGVSAVYAENYAAAVAYKAGAGASTTMKDGQTAANYLTGFGAQLGMSAGQFADYIIAENRRIGPTAYQVEQEYLHLAYTAIPQETDIDRLLAYPDDYRRFCGL